MAKRRFDVLIEREPDDGVWVTYVPALDWLSTFGDTREEALDQTKEAILGYLEALAKEGLSLADVAPARETIEIEVSVP